jgi:hypothetical protein
MRAGQTYLFVALCAFFVGCGGDDTAGTQGSNVNTGSGGSAGSASGTGGSAGNVGSGGSSSGTAGSGGTSTGAGGSNGSSGSNAGGQGGSAGNAMTEAGASGSAGGIRDAAADSPDVWNACAGKMCGDLCNSCPPSQPLCPGAVAHCNRQGICEIGVSVACD